MTDEQQRNSEDIRQQQAGSRGLEGDHDQLVEPTRAFDELSKLVLGEQSLTAVLQRVAALAKTVVPDAREVSVTLMKDNQEPQTVVFTGSLAERLDERQYEAGFGPCMDAAVTGTTIQVSNLDPDSPYPEFSRVAVKSGVSHSLSVGLPVPQRIVGALNLYAAGDRAFDQQAVELAETFAQYAAVAIANAALYSSTASLAAQMKTAMQSPSVIEQAKGIIMARNRCSADEAFTILVTMSQRRNQKLRILAQEIVDRVTTN
jgi:transcriptional regulator with GAF, ATPase, and Fis domain